MTGARGLFGRLRGGGSETPPPSRPGRMQLSHVGFCGKVPSVGDFIARGLPSAERDRFEAFLNAGLRDIAHEPGFGEAWSVMPIWRFAARPGAITQAMCVGIVLPSVDRVGRRFPLAVLALGAPGVDADPDALLTAAAPFLAEVEAAALRALDPSSPPDAAFAEVMRRRDLPPPAPGVAGGAACVWETDGGRTGAAARLPSAGAPPPAATLRAMLAAAGDPQAAMAALAAAAPARDAALFAHPPAPEAALFAQAPTPDIPLAPQAEAPIFAAPEGQPMFGSPLASNIADEAPLFPEPAPIALPAPSQADEGAIQPRIFLDEQAKLANDPDGTASQQAPETQDPTAPDDAADDNVFAAAYQAMAAEKPTAQDGPDLFPRRDDHTGASVPPEGAPHDGGDRS